MKLQNKMKMEIVAAGGKLMLSENQLEKFSSPFSLKKGGNVVAFMFSVHYTYIQYMVNE